VAGGQAVPGPRHGIPAQRSAADAAPTGGEVFPGVFVTSGAPGAGPDRSDLLRQLHDHYADKELLEATFGVSTAPEVVTAVLARRNTDDGRAAALVEELGAHYAAREQLFAATGCTSTAEVAALVRDLRTHIEGLVTRSRLRVESRAARLEELERLLGP
jgi:hypothetical protein